MKFAHFEWAFCWANKELFRLRFVCLRLFVCVCVCRSRLKSPLRRRSRTLDFEFKLVMCLGAFISWSDRVDFTYSYKVYIW